MVAGKLKTTDFIFALFSATAVSVFYFTYTSNNLVVGFTSDDAVYLLLADLYSFRHADYPLLYDFIRQQSYFPPLYPMLLGLFGAGADNPALAASITVFTLLVSVFIATIWIWRVTASHRVAFSIALLLFFLPGTLILAQELWSEFLFMLFLYGAFLLADKRELTNQDWLAIAVLVALATLSRSAGLALALAFCLTLIIKRKPTGIIPGLISLLPFLFLTLSRKVQDDRQGYFSRVTELPADLTITTLFNLGLAKIVVLFDSLVWLFNSIDTGMFHHNFSKVVLLILIVPLFAGFIVRIRLLRLDALFVLFYLPMILIWPYNEVYYVSRFLYPLLPLLMLYTVLGIQRILPASYKKLVLLAFFMMLVMIARPASTQFIQRGYADLPETVKPYTRDRSWLLAPTDNEAMQGALTTRFIIQTLGIISASVPESECIYGLQSPLIMLHTRRIAGTLPPVETNQIEFFEQTMQCPFIIAMPAQDNKGAFPEYYPVLRLPVTAYTTTMYLADADNEASPRIFLLERNENTRPPE